LQQEQQQRSLEKKPQIHLLEDKPQFLFCQRAMIGRDDLISV